MDVNDYGAVVACQGSEKGPSLRAVESFGNKGTGLKRP